jgi:hypothetical protein
MKPNATAALYRRDEVAETVDMRIDESSLRHIMSVLTDLYSDPILAVIREYSTNALDSHIDAGQTRPIEVSLPTPSHRQFVVQDFGVGLSVDDIRKIYSAYGASTKRDSNAVTGMLGLGSKSGLTYTNTFTVESVKNGVKVIASVTKDESNVGAIKILDTFGTEEDNGVKITVPIRSGHWEHEQFVNKANQFFRFWRDGVLVDGKEPTAVEGFQIDPDVILTNDSYERYVVMGNVAYPVEYSYNNNSQGWVAWVDMGAVDFTPSREALHMTAQTKETIDTIEWFVSTRTQQVIQEYLSSADTGWERARRYREITKNVGYRRNMASHFKMLELPEERDVWRASIDKSGEGSSSKYSGFGIFPLIDDVMTEKTIVRNFPFKRVSKKHLRQMHALDADQRHFVLLPDGLDLTTYNGMPSIKWEDVPQVEKEKSPTGRVKANVEYAVWKDGSCSYIDQNMIDEENEDDLDVYYSALHETHSRDISKMFPDAMVVWMRDRQVTKFCRLYPHAKNVTDVAKKKFAKVMKKFSADDIAYCSLSSGDVNHIDRLVRLENSTRSQITDPLIRALIDKFSTFNEPAAIGEARQYLNIWPNLPLGSGITDQTRNYIRNKSRGYSYNANISPEVQEILTRYPLITDVPYHRNQEAALNYINDAYEKYFAADDAATAAA